MSPGKSWGDNKAKDPGFHPRRFWPIPYSVSQLMALLTGSEVLWRGGVRRLVNCPHPWLLLCRDRCRASGPHKKSHLGWWHSERACGTTERALWLPCSPPQSPQLGLSAHGNSPAVLGCLAPGDGLCCTLPLSKLWGSGVGDRT